MEHKVPKPPDLLATPMRFELTGELIDKLLGLTDENLRATLRVLKAGTISFEALMIAVNDEPLFPDLKPVDPEFWAAEDRAHREHEERLAKSRRSIEEFIASIFPKEEQALREHGKDSDTEQVD
jgi:hypothetical protein